MAPTRCKAVATLDSDELSFVQRLFQNGDVQSDGRISVAQMLACVEKMEFIVDGSPEELVRSVVPAAAEVDRLSLNDAIKVASAAKTQGQGSAAPEAPSIGREDSLAELEHSFNRQVLSGEITADIIEEEPRAPSLGREDSLAQLESSFKKQVLSGNIPTEIAEGPEGSDTPPAPAAVSVGLDVPKRRTSVAGVFPVAASSPHNSARSMGSRGGSAEPVVVTDVPKRRASVAGGSPSAMQGPEPVVVDNFPKRRSSVARPGGGSLSGLQAFGGAGVYDDDDSTMPATPEMLRQTSEQELLKTAGSLGVEPVEASSVPKKRRSFTLSQSWKEAAAQESAKALEAKKLLEAKEAEEERQRAETEKARAEVEACLSRLTDQVEHNSEMARAREEAERRARVAASEMAQAREEAEKSARAAALEIQRAEAAAAHTEVETALRLMVESLERNAAVAEAREEAERLVKKEAEAREVAEAKAAEACKKAEEEARAREEEAKAEEDARLALQVEAELLRSKLQEAGEEAAERAQEEAQSKAQKEAEKLRQAEEQVEREAKLTAEAKRASEREAEVREAADRDAKAWEERFQALQKEREEEALRAKEELKRAVEEAREFEKAKVLALRAAEERHPLAGANVSYEDVDNREGKSWWQCIVCVPSEDPNDYGTGGGGGFQGEDDDEAAVSGMTPELWIKASGNTASTRSMDRPGKGDVCIIS